MRGARCLIERVAVARFIIFERRGNAKADGDVGVTLRIRSV
jgi:hypothetical protein